MNQGALAQSRLATASKWSGALVRRRPVASRTASPTTARSTRGSPTQRAPTDPLLRDLPRDRGLRRAGLERSCRLSARSRPSTDRALTVLTVEGATGEQVDGA